MSNLNDVLVHSALALIIKHQKGLLLGVRDEVIGSDCPTPKWYPDKSGREHAGDVNLVYGANDLKATQRQSLNKIIESLS